MRASPGVFVFVLLSCAVPAAAQVTPPGVDAACAATCQQQFGPRTASSRKFRIEPQGGGDCPTPWNTTTNACVASFLSCFGKCGLYDDACKAPCYAPVQACCSANAALNATHYLEVCLAACPKGPAAPTTSMAPRRMTTPPEPELERSATRDVGMSPEDYDNWRRTRALDEVQAKLSEMKGAFAVVSGGQGRIWIVKANGERVKLNDDLAGWLRLAERGAKTPEEQRVALSASESAMARLREMGFAPDDAGHIVDSITLSRGFPAGQAMYFPPNGRWPAEMLKYRTSSEHASIRGTINGGGDFI